MKLKFRPEELLQEADVEEIAGNGVVLGDGVAEGDAVVVHRGVDPPVVEEVGEVLVQEVDEPLHRRRRPLRLRAAAFFFVLRRRRPPLHRAALRRPVLPPVADGEEERGWFGGDGRSPER